MSDATVVPAGPRTINPAVFTSYEATLKVFREDYNYPGLVELEIEDQDSDGTGTRSFASFSIDTTQIDALIEALKAAKELAEIGLAEYNATGR